MLHRAAHAALAAAWWRARSTLAQSIAVALMNIPILSYGLALGWVSLASGKNGANESNSAHEHGSDGGVVAAAAVTFVSSLLAAPLVAALLARGRKLAVSAASAAFLVCWVVKLCGGAGGTGGAGGVGCGGAGSVAALIVARVAAGAAGALAWAAGPLMAAESVGGGASAVGAAAAHNAGLLLMYLAAAAQLSHQTVLWWCTGLSAAHCVLFLVVPESPAFLAANGRQKDAVRALARLHASGAADARLAPRLAALPPPELVPASLITQAKELMSDRQRRRAFYISCFAVLGQELCGLSSLMQFAQRALAGEGDGGASGEGGEDSGASGAVLLGAVQLVAALLALPLLDRVGRRPLLLVSALATGACLAAAAGGRRGAWLAAALAADAAGVQVVPYALLADMFSYQYRGCALQLASAAAAGGNALEVLLFPLLTHAAGVRAALVFAAVCTFLYAAVLALTVPETRGRDLSDIYQQIAPAPTNDSEIGSTDTQCSDKQLDQIKTQDTFSEKFVSVVEGREPTSCCSGQVCTKC